MSASPPCPTKVEAWTGTEASAARATRTTLIQLAWLWLRYQPGSALAAWFRERVGTLQGRTRRIAIVAMARKLLIALWRYVESGLLPDGIEIRDAAAAKA
jgi:transposase